MFFEHADARMKVLAEQWVKKQSDYEERERTGGYYQAFNTFVKSSTIKSN